MMMNPTTPYVPGTYAKKRPEAGAVASQYVREWEARRQKLSQKKPAFRPKSRPASAFRARSASGPWKWRTSWPASSTACSRPRDPGAHERRHPLDKETVKFYDELYPGKTVELSALLFGKKSFQMDDYLRNLVNAVYSLAAVGSTIFVGRGTHLILPRDRVLAVRLICSDEFRIERLASLLKIDTAEAARTLVKIDREQTGFFKKAYSRKDAPASEFDLVVNFDHLGDPRWRRTWWHAPFATSSGTN